MSQFILSSKGSDISRYLLFHNIVTILVYFCTRRAWIATIGRVMQHVFFGGGGDFASFLRENEGHHCPPPFHAEKT